MSKKFRILATSDVHGTIYPNKYSDGTEEDMGFAKIKTLFDEYRDENTIFIDNGDLIQGNPLTFYTSVYYKDEISPVTKVVDYMNFDYMNLGNHDFNLGTDTLQRHLNNINATCITSNVKLFGNKLSKDYHIHTFANGVKIAIFGIVTDYLVNWEKKENLVGVEVFSAFESAKKSIELIRQIEKVDAIVGVYHGGFETDIEGKVSGTSTTGENVGYKMCKELDFDILITGHQHRSISSNCCGKIVTQTVQMGKEVAIVEFDINEKAGTCDILIPKCEASKEILNMVQEIEAEVQKWLDTPLGEVEQSLRIDDEFQARLHKHPIVSFMNQVQLEKTGADFSAVALFNGAEGFNNSITMRDIVSTYVYSNTLSVLKIQGHTFKQFLEKCAEYFDIENNEIVVNRAYLIPKPLHFNYDMVDGLDYTIDVSKPIGNRITQMSINNIVLNLDKYYSFVVSSYRASGGDFFMLKECELIREIQEDMVDILAEYISKNKKVIINHKANIKVIC